MTHGLSCAMGRVNSKFRRREFDKSPDPSSIQNDTRAPPKAGSSFPRLSPLTPSCRAAIRLVGVLPRIEHRRSRVIFWPWRIWRRVHPKLECWCLVASATNCPRDWSHHVCRPRRTFEGRLRACRLPRSPSSWPERSHGAEQAARAAPASLFRAVSSIGAICSQSKSDSSGVGCMAYASCSRARRRISPSASLAARFEAVRWLTIGGERVGRGYAR